MCHNFRLIHQLEVGYSHMSWTMTQGRYVIELGTSVGVGTPLHSWSTLVGQAIGDLRCV